MRYDVMEDPEQCCKQSAGGQELLYGLDKEVFNKRAISKLHHHKRE